MLTVPKTMPHFLKFSKSKVVYLLGFLSLCLIFFIPWVFLLKTESIHVTRLDASGKNFEEEVGVSTKSWTPYARISKSFLNAVIVAEDGRFFEHMGIDPAEIYHSYKINQKRKRYVRGGSTITQQVVKMSFLTREKTIVRKIREVLGALILEQILTKEEILEWYVNLTEFGGGVYGVKSAGYYYFKTKPELLTIEQSLLLASVIPNPNKWSKGLRQKLLTDFGHKRFASLATKMLRRNFIAKKQWENALLCGDFGRPIKGYESLRQPEIIPKDDEIIEEEDLEDESPESQLIELKGP